MQADQAVVCRHPDKLLLDRRGKEWSCHNVDQRFRECCAHCLNQDRGDPSHVCSADLNHDASHRGAYWSGFVDESGPDEGIRWAEQPWGITGIRK